MTSPLDRLIDASVRCIVCGAPGVGTCLCWKTTCSCGSAKPSGVRACSKPHHEADRAASICACDRPGAHGRVCADARGNKTSCRCACHRGRAKGAPGQVRRTSLDRLRDELADLTPEARAAVLRDLWDGSDREGGST